MKRASRSGSGKCSEFPCNVPINSAAESYEDNGMSQNHSGKHVVITGSSQGIGYALANEFLRFGATVTISSRHEKKIDEALSRLMITHRSENMFGHVCDVTECEQVQALWDASKARFGKINIWINNAGVGQGRIPLWRLPPDQLRNATETNLLGAMNGSAVAIKGMLGQGFGAIYNVLGFGSNGRKMKGLTLYGTTKYGLAYLTDGLVLETKGTPVIVGAISPGMVVTELLTKPFEGRPAEWERAKRVFNILAERAETVAPWIAQRVLSNNRTGIHIRWLTKRRFIRRIVSAPFTKRDLFT